MATGRLRLRLFSHDEMVLLPDEVARILRHRVMMVFYLTGLIALIALNWDKRVPGLPMELHAPPQIAGVLAGGLVPAVMLLWAARRARRGKDVVVSASRLFLSAAVLGFSGYNLLAVPLGVAPAPSVHHAVLDIAFNYVLAEIIGGVAVHFVVPPLLSDLRRLADVPAPAGVVAPGRAAPVDRGAQGQGADPDDSAVAEPARRSAAAVIAAARRTDAPEPDRPPQVRVANRLFDAGDILLIRAERTHVILTTPRGRQTLPGPFSAVVAQLPPELGQQVSRSDWVATAAVHAVRRDGREVILRCRSGQEVRVAASRLGKLRDWLQRLAEEPQRAAS